MRSWFWKQTSSWTHLGLVEDQTQDRRHQLGLVPGTLLVLVGFGRRLLHKRRHAVRSAVRSVPSRCRQAWTESDFPTRAGVKAPPTPSGSGCVQVPSEKSDHVIRSSVPLPSGHLETPGKTCIRLCSAQEPSGLSSSARLRWRLKQPVRRSDSERST